MLKIDGITKTFDGTVKAIKGLSLEVNSGEVFCMLGANGAGKTTTINTILNFIEPDSGEITVNGVNVVKDPLEAKKHLAYVSENVTLYENFTAYQNLDFFAKLGGKKDMKREDYARVLKRVGLPEEANTRRLKTFSKGMRQKCGIAIAIIKDAAVFLLDEPTSGLDPAAGKEFMDLLTQLRSEGKAIFMTTHDIFRAKVIADKLGIMVQGNLVKVMDKDEIRTTNLEEVYMKYVEMKEDAEAVQTA